MKRCEIKDAYDVLSGLLSYDDGTTRQVAERFAVIAEADEAKQALTILHEDFASTDHLVPLRYAEFLTGRRDPARQADAFGFVQEFLRRAGGDRVV